MRIAVVGTSGSGKTTMAKRLSAGFDLPHVEMDAVNWQPGWYDLAQNEPEEFRRCIREATDGDAWVCDGGYGTVRDIVWSRATHLVWLDYSRARIMSRVIRRSIWRVVDRHELWAGSGNREDWRKWFTAEHPIRWAWNTWAGRRANFEEMTGLPDYAHLHVFRLRHPREVRGVIADLAGDAESP